MKKRIIISTVFISSLLFSCATKQEQLEGIWLITSVDGKDVTKEDVKLNLGKEGVAVIASKGIVGTWLLTSDSTIELRESRRKSAEKLQIITLTSEELVLVGKGDTTTLKKVKE